MHKLSNGYNFSNILFFYLKINVKPTKDNYFGFLDWKYKFKFKVQVQVEQKKFQVWDKLLISSQTIILSTNRSSSQTKIFFYQKCLYGPPTPTPLFLRCVPSFKSLAQVLIKKEEESEEQTCQKQGFNLEGQDRR